MQLLRNSFLIVGISYIFSCKIGNNSIENRNKEIEFLSKQAILEDNIYCNNNIIIFKKVMPNLEGETGYTEYRYKYQSTDYEFLFIDNIGPEGEQGVSYKITKNSVVDFGLAHINIKDTSNLVDKLCSLEILNMLHRSE